MRRATLVFFDEAAYSSDELIVACEAFAAQNTSFITDTDSDYDPALEPKRVPTQLVYASSQDNTDTTFYKNYKTFAKQYYAGNNDYFVCDMVCDVAMTPYMNGKKYMPLLTQDKVDSALRTNKDKALREYYNEPTRDGGTSQIIKWGTVRRNESFYLPILCSDNKRKTVIAFDPARTIDNSILGMMQIYFDDDVGWCGDIVNCVNLIDIASRKHYKLDSNRQLEEIRNYIHLYNGKAPDYENIDSLLIDQGAGGGGTSTYADNLLNNWTDRSDAPHRGLIDASHDIYAGYSNLYPDAVDILRLLSPRKFRTQMVEEAIELTNLGVIHFPYEYAGGTSMKIITGGSTKNKDGDISESIVDRELSEDEMTALMQIDLMKTEITSIHRFMNAEKTTVAYALSKEKENRMHDDRFYVYIMLAHRLYEIRRGYTIESGKVSESHNYSTNNVTEISF